MKSKVPTVRQAKWLMALWVLVSTAAMVVSFCVWRLELSSWIACTINCVWVVTVGCLTGVPGRGKWHWRIVILYHALGILSTGAFWILLLSGGGTASRGRIVSMVVWTGYQIALSFAIWFLVFRWPQRKKGLPPRVT